MDITSWITQESVGYIIKGLWILLNIALFISTHVHYANAPEYAYLRQVVGAGLPLARASAMCINFNSMLALLPVCRNFLLLLSNAIGCDYKVSYQLWKNVHYHRIVGTSIFFFSVIHVFSHCCNYQLLYDSHFLDDTLVSLLNNLPVQNNGTQFNPITETDYGAFYQMLKTVPGVTGWVLLIILALIGSSSLPIIRRSYYELFWIVHHLFVIFYVLLFLHGTQGVIRHQINMLDNNPLTCAREVNEWGQENHCKIPYFSQNGSQTWKWILLPVVLYGIERCIRFWRSWESVAIVKVIPHPASVLELQLLKSNFNFHPGQYIYLQCPIISKFEWHPFTLTSASKEPYFSIHVRQAGDWTEKLITKFTTALAVDGLKRFPRLAVDGPYGSPSQRVFLYKKVVLIGAGIGVTPFASILKSCLYRTEDNFVENIHFFWLCSKPQAFEWFANFLKDLEAKLQLDQRNDFIQYHIYLTRGWDMNHVWKLYLHDRDDTDFVTGFKQKTNFGRPNWDPIFSKIANSFDGYDM